ncbi:hypothetical protein F4678DRAFT_120321 [Xylaria arbuscula]|nr:hypothetical protein F4678DRAFT_120321 [Xylaria arbuscula]
MDTRSFFVHPHAGVRRSQRTSAEQRQPPIRAATTIVDSSVPTRRQQQDTGTRKMMAEMKISLAANQLSEQAKESITFWRQFREEYLEEVDRIKVYVGADILQRVWQKKVGYNGKYRGGEGKDCHRFDVQSMKLESCLSQVDEATKLLAGAWSSDHNNDYNSRRHHLAKLRAAGDLVVDLSKRSVKNEAACSDLLVELAELGKLVDSNSAAAAMLHHFNQHQARREEVNADHSSEEPANEDSNVQAEHGSGDYRSNDWVDDGDEN